MKTVATIALKPGMILGEDIATSQNGIIASKGASVDAILISKLNRYSIVCVPIMEDIDFATTHFEKVRLSTEFKYFEMTYNDCMSVYKRIMNDFIESKIPFRIGRLMELHDKITSCAKTGEQLIDFLYNMLPSEDDMTHAHCLNSALIAGIFGTWLGLSKDDINLLIQCGFFYDIGKLKLPYQLIWKPGKLTELEFTQMKTHTMIGFNLLKDLDMNEHILKATLQHHEKCDGSGYPSKLKSEKIDVFAKYIAIIDAYEAMTSARTYRQSLNPFQVIANFEKTGFDKYGEENIRPILAHIAQTQLGYTVRLNNDKEAQIVLINQDKLSRPLLKDGQNTIDLREQPDLFIEAIF